VCAGGGSSTPPILEQNQGLVRSRSRLCVKPRFRPVRHWNCLEIQKRLRRLRHIVARLWQKTVDFQRLRVRHHDAPISLGFDALLSVEKMTGPFAIPSYSRPPSLT
jgi:hypothetical protein